MHYACDNGDFSSRWSVRVVTFIAGVVATCACAAPAAEPLAPAAALADFQLPQDYRIELVAAEPEVVDPVAIAFDAQGRLWVVEMRDYPTLAQGAAPSSRIRILWDRDGDGHYESAQTFADGLLFPTGLQLWGSGAFVTLAGEVAFFPDENGDGRADRKETWYEGFATVNEQLRANHPTLAADGWIYVAGGLRGGEINNRRRPGDPPVVINGRDFAFNPRTGEFRAASGNGQFGLVIDDFGRRFTCSNRNPFMQVMIEQRYLDRNPDLILPRVVHDVAAPGIESRLYPRSRALTTSAQHAGQFTAACGVEIYGDNALPVDARGCAFICEPTANLVHRELIEAVGATMTGRQVEHQTEFLTATDEWFRPVNLCTGPDGALYVVDMYRAVIEHPEWMTEELRDRPDLRDGADRGRIYRIVAAREPTGASMLAAFDKADLKLSAVALEHPIAWQRNLAARSILESTDPPLAELQRVSNESSSPAARSLALSLLDAHLALSADAAIRSLQDLSPEVREHGLRLAESQSGKPAVAAAILRMAQDPSSRVRYQAALSLMFLPSETALDALLKIARRDHDDAWSCRAVALASRERAAELVLAVLPRAKSAGNGSISIRPSPRLLQEAANAAVAVGRSESAATILQELPRSDADAIPIVLLSLARALESRGTTFTAAMSMVQQRNASAYNDLIAFFDRAQALVANPNAEEADRVSAIELLGLQPRRETSSLLLAQIADAETSPALKLAALGALRFYAEVEVAQTLLDFLPDQLPSVRRRIIDVLASRSEWAAELLAAAELDDTLAEEIGPTHRMSLLQHADAQVKQRADRLFGAAVQDRVAVMNRYQQALTLRGNADRGRQVFVASCASCHRIGDEGAAVGPDIGDSSMKSSEQLLTDILDPNRAIDANYVSYTALTIDGIAHQGIIQSETDGGIVLLSADGKTVTVLKDELESLTSGKSLMPEGLEQQISPKQMADLLMYLKTWRHVDDLRRAGSDQHGAPAGSSSPPAK